jgi:hypothetical protein
MDLFDRDSQAERNKRMRSPEPEPISSRTRPRVTNTPPNMRRSHNHFQQQSPSIPRDIGFHSPVDDAFLGPSNPDPRLRNNQAMQTTKITNPEYAFIYTSGSYDAGQGVGSVPVSEYGPDITYHREPRQAERDSRTQRLTPLTGTPWAQRSNSIQFQIQGLSASLLEPSSLL